jgi:cellulose synthase/poly-beta-1,6-N-acetylglucosamine synthase-like glycosyltransferase
MPRSAAARTLPALRLVGGRTQPGTAAAPALPPLGEALLARGLIDRVVLGQAIALSVRHGVPLARVLVARGWIAERRLSRLQASRWSAPLSDLAALPPDPRLVEAVGAGPCLEHGLLPLRRLAGATVVATADPDRFAEATAALPQELGPFVMAIAPESDIHAALSSDPTGEIADRAESWPEAADSARSFSPARTRTFAALSVLACAAWVALAPKTALLAAMTLAVIVLFSLTFLKAAALAARLRAPLEDPPLPGETLRQPVVTLLVALYQESTVLPRLLDRLGQMDYPPELLDILLLVESGDTETRKALSEASVPPNARVVVLPQGGLRTKPRALNFGMAFARGSIIGIYDAEDLPDPAQVARAVRKFAAAPPRVACLQSVLDFYQPRRNWLSRCFAIDYAGWFRVVLPGLARLGLVVPLGGTSVFLRRTALEDVGGWDAHNVTEDADLGLRLARFGYQTRLLASTTEEEPNIRIGAWIRQRARWQKGYAMTWAVAMRSPRMLWRELGPARFLQVQVLFLGTLLQPLLAPLLWSFWGLAFGLGPSVLPGAAAYLAPLFVLSALVNLMVHAIALSGPQHRHLLPWVPAMAIYAALATLSVLRALADLALRPFHWDKTDHGHVLPPSGHGAAAPPAQITAAPAPLALPAPVGTVAGRLLTDRERGVIAAIGRHVRRERSLAEVTATQPVAVNPPAAVPPTHRVSGASRTPG